MTRYTQDEEERIRAQILVREWSRSKLIDKAQCTRLEDELRLDVKRTNVFLRLVLALFTCLVVGASIAFVAATNRIETDTPIAILAGVSAVACFALAELFVGQFRFYRFGVEEALAVGAAVLAGVSASFAPHNPFDIPRIVVGLAIGAGVGVGVYLRFGYVYVAIGSLAALAAVPFQLAWTTSVQHAGASAILAVGFLMARVKRLRYDDDYPGDDYGLIQAAAWVGLYLALNVRLTRDLFEGRFYWFTYGMTWLLPIAGLVLSLRSKDRPLLDVSLLMMLGTLSTNKPYLGLERREWDPMLLGSLLIIVALVIRRWLSSGTNGERDGFTSTRLLHKDSALLAAISTASVITQPNAPSSHTAPDTTGFGGGRSGGAGGGASY